MVKFEKWIRNNLFVLTIRIKLKIRSINFGVYIMETH